MSSSTDAILGVVPALRDQREMVAVARPAGRVDPGAHDTPDDVKAAWEAWGEHQGFAIRRRRGDHDTGLRHSRETVKAYVSGGSWIADCPGCGGGIACWPGHAKGCCLDCGTVYPVTYPSRAAIGEAEPVLLARPREQQTWYPWEETTADLKRENVQRGYALDPAAQEASDARMVAAFLKDHGPQGEAFLRRAGVLPQTL
jgi:hypothetical protein